MKKFFLIVAIGLLCGLSGCGENSVENTISENTSAQNSTTKSSEISAVTETDSETEILTSDTNLPDNTESDTFQTESSEETEILVAYFSATNNTEGIAQKLADGLGADLYEITPEQPYTAEDLDYGNSESRSSVEMNDPSARPAISGSVENMEQYDVVLIGYPIWWGEAPRIMSTFMESYDFSGKTLAAFCTSASSEFGDSDAALRESASSATWLDGQRFSASASEEDVLAWADEIGLK